MLRQNKPNRERGSNSLLMNLWTSKGKRIPIDKLSDEHLGNALRYCEDRASAVTEMLRGEPGCDRGIYENGVDPEQLFPLYLELCCEELRRGL